MSEPFASPAPVHITFEHDPAQRVVRVISDFDGEDFIEVRRQRVTPLHFDRFVQVHAAAWVLPLLLQLPARELRVWLAVVLTADRDNRGTLTSAELADATGLAPAVVSRALTALYRRDLLRPTGRTVEGRTWMVSPDLAFRAPARLSDQVKNVWASLPPAPEPAED